STILRGVLGHGLERFIMLDGLGPAKDLTGVLNGRPMRLLPRSAHRATTRPRAAGLIKCSSASRGANAAASTAIHRSPITE
ncbi:hypothetical protein OAV43_04205, partial [Pseudomonadales bacterium]|nr:hypothetical protein [Pseudomonadales bacterium]